jgi:DNA modification methylase
LYFYTQPFDIVVDPFAGSGSTINICKKRLRRYWVSDRKPIPERAHEMRLWDMTEGLPPLHNWRDAKLVYLDPPYWKQVEGKYSQDATDLANMTLEDFTITLARVITDFGKKLQTGAHIALIIQPTHWYAPEHAYTDHAMDMIKAIKLPLARRIACPCDTPRYTEYLKWCLEHREMLSLNREIIVWRVP